MTSQLNVDTIVDKAGTGGPTVQSPTLTEMTNTSTYVSDGGNVSQNTVQGLAKSWCNLNGTGTIAIRDSLNIASATDNGLGHYTFNISNDMGNANYAVTFGSSAANSVNDGGWLGIKYGTTNASGSFIVITDGRTVGEYDPLYTIVSVLGDLA